ncbi:MAG: DNA-directed RNA polymerase subunit omega [Bacteroides sp.]|jgi:DNA-directed RNA polymerase subunit K/omega|nr:DNA-directed RNA polymerase subunit omega [Bacteroides sp.]
MDYKKVKAESTTVTRDLRQFDKENGNIYQTVVIISKRANQIGLEMKEELNGKLEEFATSTDNLEEIFENREQIEIARFYEQLPKPSLISISEYENGNVYFRVPEEEPKK